MSYYWWAFFIAAVCALVGWYIGDNKGRAGAGLALGLLLGIFGIIVIALLPPTREKQTERDAQLARAIVGASTPAQLPFQHHVQTHLPPLPAQMAPLRRCPYCAETIQWDARKCKHCGEFSEPPAEAQVPPSAVHGSPVPQSPMITCPRCGRQYNAAKIASCPGCAGRHPQAQALDAAPYIGDTSMIKCEHCDRAYNGSKLAACPRCGAPSPVDE